MEKVSFEFPDETRDTSKDIKIKEDGSAEVIVDGRRESFANTPSKKSNDADDEAIDIEVVDDTPKRDRNRKPSAPPDELTDDELESYSDKVKKRLQHFSKGYHDQRRVAEQAAREKSELEAMKRDAPQKSIMNLNFDVTVSYIPEDGGQTVIDTLVGCEFTEDKKSMKQGDKNMIVELPFIFTSIKSQQ
jgi:hypothetical protein